MSQNEKQEEDKKQKQEVGEQSPRCLQWPEDRGYTEGIKMPTKNTSGQLETSVQQNK